MMAATKRRSDEATKVGKQKAENGKQKSATPKTASAKAKCQAVAPAKKAVLTAFLACVGLWHWTGCGLTKALSAGPADMMSAAAKAGEAVATKILDEGVLESWASNVDGHVQDPGIESYVSVTCAAGVRAKGVNGNVVASAKGDATRLPAGVRNGIIDNCQAKTRTPEEFSQCMSVLTEFNRTAAGGNPNLPPLTVERAMTAGELAEVLRNLGLKPESDEVPKAALAPDKPATEP